MPDASASVTLKEVARATGLALSTVSYALRGAPNVPEPTARRVREAAARLGYRRNSRVAELMAQIRRGRRPEAGDRIALVWVEDGRAPQGLGRNIADGARRRAAAHGYGLEDVTLAEAGGSPRRLANILQARGIAGVVFAPAVRRARVEIDWPWERFAMAVIGTAEWNAPLSRAAHHHYEAMRLALSALGRAGARRPAALFDAVTNERAHRGWQAAWLAYAPKGAARRLWLTTNEPGEDALRAWLREIRPDALVVRDPAQGARLRAAGWPGPAERLVALDRQGHAGGAGVDQDYATIAGHAVDLVVAQLQGNERGLPETPRTLLFPGRWVEAGRPAEPAAPQARGRPAGDAAG